MDLRQGRWLRDPRPVNTVKQSNKYDALIASVKAIAEAAPYMSRFEVSAVERISDIARRIT